MKIKVIFLFLIASFSLVQLFSQNIRDYKFDKLSISDFAISSPLVDSNVNAVIIADVGKTSFVGNSTNRWVSYVFEKHIRIKILHKKEIDNLATFEVPLYGRNERQDKLEVIKASTYNIENGIVVESKLNNQDIINEQYNKNIAIRKFPLPAVKEGSIIEYAYKITSYRYSRIPSWSFQHLKYPCLLSDFAVSIPQMLRFSIIKHGLDSFYLKKSEESKQSLVLADLVVNSVVNNLRWVMKDISAFKVENYLYAPDDYLDKLEFNLIQTYNGNEVNNIMTDWKTVNSQLLDDSEFGSAIDKESAVNLLNTAEKVCGDVTSPKEMAKLLYAYVRDNFTYIGNDDIYLTNDLYDINKKRSGNSADLNLLLIALLRQKNIQANPVILSTREYGVHPINYPVLDKMNYVICMTKIDGDTLFLDATHPRLGFGKLMLNCYNGHARIISRTDSGSVYLYPKMVKDLKMLAVSLHNTEEQKNAISGTVEETTGYFESVDIRDEIAQRGLTNYTKEVKLNSDLDFTITNFGIDSMTEYTEPLKIHFDIATEISSGDDFIYFNPMLSGRYKENPFAEANRRYPVEMPFPVNNVYVLNMDVPAGYSIQELPKSTKVKFNETEGEFDYIVRSDGKKIQLVCKLNLYESTFFPQDYSFLRDFFAYVVKKQSEQIVFKKNK